MHIITELPVRFGSVRIFTRWRFQFYKYNRQAVQKENYIRSFVAVFNKCPLISNDKGVIVGIFVVNEIDDRGAFLTVNKISDRNTVLQIVHKNSIFLHKLSVFNIFKFGNTEGVNPKGALIGPGGARVRAVMENLGPEKIDIVDWSADPAKFVAAALSPAVATGVQVISEKNQTAIAFIHDDQLSLAIGKEGQNARLAAKLTGWKIGIESAEAHAKKMAEAQASTSGETAE